MKIFSLFFCLILVSLQVQAQINEDSARIEKMESKIRWLEDLARDNAMRIKALENNAREKKTTRKSIQFQSVDSVVAEKEKGSAFSFSGYVDTYYAYYTDSVGEDNFQKFPTVAPKSNSLGLNIAMFTAKYSGDKIRAAISLHFGDVALSSWSTSFNFIQEANAGLRISKKLWLDVGFFKTHVGTESLLPKDNLVSSIAVGTYYEPYFESGFRLNYNPTKKLALNLYLLNGYNLFEDNNRKKSLGFLGSYSFNDNFNINYSNYLGDDSPLGDSLQHIRFYNNAYINWQYKKIKIQTGGDYCLHQHADSTKFRAMYSALLSMKYKLVSKFSVYGRGEIFNDQSGFLSGLFYNKINHLTGLKLWGVTSGIEYSPSKNSYIRLEGRRLQDIANQEIFRWKGQGKNNRFEIMIHLGISF